MNALVRRTTDIIEYRLWHKNYSTFSNGDVHKLKRGGKAPHKGTGQSLSRGEKGGDLIVLNYYYYWYRMV